MRRRIPYLLCALFAAGACGDDPSGPGAEDSLTDAERVALVEALLSTTGFGPDAAAAGGAPEPAAGETLVFPVEESLPCEHGGTVAVEGRVTLTLEEGVGTGEYAHEIVQVHGGCTVSAGDGAVTFRFDGDPSVTSTLAATFDVNGDVEDFEGSESGSIRWRLGARSGRCVLAIEYTLTGSPAPAYRVTGSVCGREFDERVPVDGGAGARGGGGHVSASPRGSRKIRGPSYAETPRRSGRPD